MKKAKIVIGANFGDEGKGLMTDYFCRKAAEAGERCLVICHNGGAQRGHTVQTRKGLRHVFHHFGSGTFAGADTWFSEDFIVNPMVFRSEWEELERLGYTPRVWMHPQCRITTPFDMILNQLIEEKRSDARHGSCGMGIYETIKRYERMNGGLERYTLHQIRDQDFYPQVKKQKLFLDKEWRAIVESDALMTHYLDDLEFMKNRVNLSGISLFSCYDTLVFEGGQGLLLDQNNREYFPHLTPSNTGLKNPQRLLSDWEKAQSRDSASRRSCETEVCYVTRPYITRHGAGRLDTACAKEEINAAMRDLTNLPNPYQGILRYGKMNPEQLKQRILRDFAGHPDWKLSLAVTHRNEVETLFARDKASAGDGAWDREEFLRDFHRVYEVWGEWLE